MKRAVWFDLENSPHPWILKDFIRAFEKQGYPVIITSRDFSQTIEISNYMQLNHTVVGAGVNSASGMKKALSIVTRAMDLVNHVASRKPVLAMSHGSRSQALAARFLGCKVVSLDDYEFSFKWFNKFVHRLYTPFCIPQDSWGISPNKVVHYPGTKEEVYLWNKSDYEGVIIPEINPERINILFRPAGDFSHYQKAKSYDLQSELINKFASVKEVTVVLSARNKQQGERLKGIFNDLGINYVTPQKVLNGPALIQQCDAIIGGGGTMTREACILGTPSYSFFSGELGAVDKYLSEDGRLKFITSVEDIAGIEFKKKSPSAPVISDKAFTFMLHDIQQFLETRN